jgi:hypothetical protein
MREHKEPKTKAVDRKLAKVLGLEIPSGPYKGLYKSLDGVNKTVITSPPRFSDNPEMLEAAVDKLLEKQVTVPRVSTKELVAALSEREGVNRVDIGYLERINLKAFDDSETGPAIILVVTD